METTTRISRKIKKGIIMSKQTAMNMLIDNLIKLGYLHSNDYGQTPNLAKVIKQAKSMEKQQIIDAYNNARATGYGEAKEYYNEIFKK